MNGLWVFGYGSLVWNPGFAYRDSKIGYICGYSRRFWQGNDVHRGTPDRPGRVATLIEDCSGITWGRAFLLENEDSNSSLAYLENREGKLGGYSATFVKFQPRDRKEDTIPVLLYIARDNNRLYIGPTSLPQLATEIATSIGNCGHNAEYLMRLAHFMRENVPEYWDDHLFTLEMLVKDRLKEENIPLKSLMGDWDVFNDDYAPRQESVTEPSTSSRTDFSSLVPSRKLRCLNI
ncbi:putative glutathione-specific gamma-glutamylcyclotransferase 2 [Centruroides sculpturatus]|uniref:putative glutathione-specific gamma-glutamylcyclotransferase 2 n=1 Tax=Centruroides sculpturatus TaxID=218467 RepID=UPI000C6D9B59|nr:putative glutathione-specific gamma-glutamylcyclotransferase 2 [Centruroides sculpturatus]